MKKHIKYITEFFGRPDAEDKMDIDKWRSQDVAKMFKDEDIAEKYADLDDMTRYIAFKQKFLDKNKARDIKELSKVNREEFYIVRDHLQRVMDNIDFDAIKDREDYIDSVDMDKVLQNINSKRNQMAEAEYADGKGDIDYWVIIDPETLSPKSQDIYTQIPMNVDNRYEAVKVSELARRIENYRGPKPTRRTIAALNILANKLEVKNNSRLKRD